VCLAVLPLPQCSFVEWCSIEGHREGFTLTCFKLNISHIKPFGAYMGQIIIIYCNFIISTFLSLKILTDPSVFRKVYNGFDV
jgi:hypothetical protein